MPVHQKEEVFNEWGAVLKHQDEIDREMKRQQDEKYRERQKNYKKQLDMQYQEFVSKKKGSHSEAVKREDQLLKAYQKDLEEKKRAEEEKRNLVLSQQRAAAFESLNEVNVMKKEQQTIQEMERQIYYNRMKMQEEIEARK